MLNPLSTTFDTDSIESVDIPVEVRGKNSEIDIACSRFYSYGNKPLRFFLVCECKNADPARSNWCFLRSPNTPGKHSLQFDGFRLFQFRNDFISTVIEGITSKTTMNLSLELRTGEKGFGIGSQDKSAINSALAQVMRGIGGYINYFHLGGRASKELDLGINYAFIPVIFTTARLFISDVDISTADIQTGKLAESSLGLDEVEWIYYNYNRSTNLCHEAPITGWFDSNGDVYFERFTRTVAIVNSRSITNFLKHEFQQECIVN